MLETLSSKLLTMHYSLAGVFVVMTIAFSAEKPWTTSVTSGVTALLPVLPPADFGLS
jgi:hypothetical protein